MSRQMERLLQIDTLLRLGGRHVSATLAAALEVSDRTVRHEQGSDPTPVTIWFDAVTAPYLRERQWHSTPAIAEHADDTLTLRLVARGLHEVKRWVLYYGKGAIVQEPPELVELVRKEITDMNKQYVEEV